MNVNGPMTTADLYKLSHPLDGHDHVVVSATMILMTEPETYIFGADPKGEIVDWTDLDGSFKGAMDHAQALSNAGYEIV